MNIHLMMISLLAVLICGRSDDVKKVYVIGDSISIHYGPYLKNFLGENFQYSRKGDQNGEAIQNLDDPVGANGGDSRMVLDFIRGKLSVPGFNPDIIVLNCGLHDIKTKPGGRDANVAQEAYRANLDTIFYLITSREIELVFVTTTPVIDSIHNKEMPYFHRYNADVKRYNGIALELAEKYDCGVIDLYGFMDMPTKPSFYIDHVHYDERYRQLQAAFIAGYLTAAYRETQTR